jgi:hypothetical protein
MIKKILVPTSGSCDDDKVFATALSVARPLAAHLEFYHVRLSDCEAAVRSRHVEFCRGAAMTGALKHLHQREAALSSAAIQHFEAFCEANDIPIITRPAAVGNGAMSAHFEQEMDVGEARLYWECPASASMAGRSSTFQDNETRPLSGLCNRNSSVIC